MLIQTLDELREEAHISQRLWVKVLGMLQQNWCVIEDGQKVEQKAGGWSEREILLCGSQASSSSDFIELSSKQCTELIRSMQSWVKVRQQRDLNIRHDLSTREAELIQILRKPSEQEISSGVRCAIWRIATIVLYPDANS
jgi:hypothetical protein